MQRICAIAAAVVLGAAAGRAHAAELRATLGSWGYHIDGAVVDRGQRYDLRDDLELDPDGRRSLRLEWDTPRGWWPDLALGYTQIAAHGDHAETTLLGTRTIETDADFDHVDLVARYGVRLGPLRAAAGLALQQLRGELVIEDSDDPAPRRERYDELIPQLHAQLRWRLGSGLTLAAVGQGIEHDGDRALDLRAVAELRFMAPLLLEIGWQEQRYEIGLADYALDARVRGALFRIGVLYR
jgi:outer membrane protein